MAAKARAMPWGQPSQLAAASPGDIRVQRSAMGSKGQRGEYAQRRRDSPTLAFKIPIRPQFPVGSLSLLYEQFPPSMRSADLAKFQSWGQARLCVSFCLSFPNSDYIFGWRSALGPHLGFWPKSQGTTHSITRAMSPGISGWSLILAVRLPWNLRGNGVGLSRAGFRLGKHHKGPQTSPHPLRTVWGGEHPEHLHLF